MIDANASSMERLGFIFGLALMTMLAFTTVAPYIFAIKSPELIRQIDQTQNTIQNLSLILAGFLYGTSVGKRMQENTIASQAKTIADAQDALAPLVSAASDKTINLAPGETATATADPDGGGTTIKPGVDNG